MRLGAVAGALALSLAAAETSPIHAFATQRLVVIVNNDGLDLPAGIQLTQAGDDAEPVGGAAPEAARVYCIRGGGGSPEETIQSCTSEIEEWESRGEKGSRSLGAGGISVRLHGFYHVDKFEFRRVLNAIAVTRGTKGYDEFAVAYNNRGTAFLVKGKISEALLDFDRAISIDRSFAVAFANRADAFRAKGDRTRALADYTEAVRLAPHWAQPRVDRGWTFVAEGKLEEAVRDFDAALELDPESAFALYGRAYVERGNGDGHSREKDLAAALALQIDVADRLRSVGAEALAAPSPAALQQARAAHCENNRLSARLRIEGCTALIATLTSESERRAEAYHLRGFLNAREYRLEAALADFTEAIRIKPNAARYRDRASAFQQKGDLKAAIADYTSVIRLHPKDADAYWRRIRLHEDREDWAAAVADYGALIRLEPQTSHWVVHRGHLRERTGDLAGAIADYSHALRKAPDNVSYLQHRAEAWLKLGAAERALADLGRVIGVKRNEVEPYLARAKALLALGRTQRAIADCDRAIKLAPDYAAAYRLRGDAHLQKRDLDGAFADYSNAIRLGEQHADIARRGLVHLLRSELDKAKHEFDFALSEWANNPVALHGRGILRQRLGNSAEALADLETAAKIDPEVVGWLRTLGLK